MRNIYDHILKSKKQNKKLFAVLIDPDKFNLNVIHEANRSKVDFIFIGGSGLNKKHFHSCIAAIRKNSKVPLVIFPGGKEQISKKADAILLLSLISGRNPDYLIGEHIRAARELKISKLEIIPTGYIIINGGKKASALKVSRTRPVNHSNLQLASSTALAGELLGMKAIYLEAGSGARNAAGKEMIRSVKKNISVPLIVGGGIDSPEKAVAACKAGADMIVAGNAIEKDHTLVKKIAQAVYSLNK